MEPLVTTLTVKRKGRIDIVFANAGGAEFAALGSITEEHFDKLFNINVRGILFTAQRGRYRYLTMAARSF
jgi:NAD(P)-dependent dehydrogenase (short-subunit alcohol dehydrogenase family)